MSSTPESYCQFPVDIQDVQPQHTELTMFFVIKPVDPAYEPLEVVLLDRGSGIGPHEIQVLEAGFYHARQNLLVSCMCLIKRRVQILPTGVSQLFHLTRISIAQSR